jgi:hypothetical protein
MTTNDAGLPLRAQQLLHLVTALRASGAQYGAR